MNECNWSYLNFYQDILRLDQRFIGAYLNIERIFYMYNIATFVTSYWLVYESLSLVTSNQSKLSLGGDHFTRVSRNLLRGSRDADHVRNQKRNFYN